MRSNSWLDEPAPFRGARVRAPSGGDTERILGCAARARAWAYETDAMTSRLMDVNARHRASRCRRPNGTRRGSLVRADAGCRRHRRHSRCPWMDGHGTRDAATAHRRAASLEYPGRPMVVMSVVGVAKSRTPVRILPMSLSVVVAGRRRNTGRRRGQCARVAAKSSPPRTLSRRLNEPLDIANEEHFEVGAPSRVRVISTRTFGLRRRESRTGSNTSPMRTTSRALRSRCVILTRSQ